MSSLMDLCVPLHAAENKRRIEEACGKNETYSLLNLQGWEPYIGIPGFVPTHTGSMPITTVNEYGDKTTVGDQSILLYDAKNGPGTLHSPLQEQGRVVMTINGALVGRQCPTDSITNMLSPNSSQLYAPFSYNQQVYRNKRGDPAFRVLNDPWVALQRHKRAVLDVAGTFDLPHEESALNGISTEGEIIIDGYFTNPGDNNEPGRMSEVVLGMAGTFSTRNTGPKSLLVGEDIYYIDFPTVVKLRDGSIVSYGDWGDDQPKEKCMPSSICLKGRDLHHSTAMVRRALISLINREFHRNQQQCDVFIDGKSAGLWKCLAECGIYKHYCTPQWWYSVLSAAETLFEFYPNNHKIALFVDFMLRAFHQEQTKVAVDYYTDCKANGFSTNNKIIADMFHKRPYASPFGCKGPIPKDKNGTQILGFDSTGVMNMRTYRRHMRVTNCIHELKEVMVHAQHDWIKKKYGGKIIAGNSPGNMIDVYRR